VNKRKAGMDTFQNWMKADSQTIKDTDTTGSKYLQEDSRKEEATNSIKGRTG
jgi:hypothetical protein